MKTLFTIFLLLGAALGQTYNTNIYPATTGLSLGRNGQRWNLYGQNIHITGTFTGPVVTSSATPATGFMNGYFKPGRGWCAKDSFGVEYCPGGGTTGGGTPGGNNTDLQYNNNNAFGGFPDGTPNQVLHGGRTFSAVDLTSDVTGILPIPNGGTGTATPSLVAGSNITITGSWPNQTINSSGGGAASTATTYIPLEDCTPDQTGNSFYSVASMTNWFNAHWEFTTNAASYINCKVRIPDTVAATPAASIVLEIAANDATSGHTANFQSCDAVVTTGFQVSAPSCAANQAFTTTTTAYERVTKTYAVQSTVAANNILIVKISTSTTGTQPSANMIVTPYLKIDQNSVGGGGGGSGTVTSFSAGDLSPLFTTSEATPSTTPALSFALSNAAAHTFFGNNSGSTAAPSYQAIGQADITGLVAALAAKGNVSNSGTPTVNQIARWVDATHIQGITLVPITSGGTGTATPALIAGTNVTITGAWPNQTINASGGGGGGPASIKSVSSYASAQAALSALTAGQTLLVDGTYTLCNGTLTTPNVTIRGGGSISGILQCATNNVPIVTISGDGVTWDLTKVKHVTNSPIAGGDGIVVSPGTTNVRITNNEISNNYNNVVLGNTSFGILENNYIFFGNNHCLSFNADGTSQVMQWLLKGNLFAQCLANGVDFTLGAAISGLHITGPTITAGNRAYGNNGYGYNFSASAATASGISDIFINGGSFSSYNNKSALRLDVGANGGRNALITGFFAELSGQSINTAGFNGTTTLTPSNTGHGVEITSACDPTNPPQINGLETWQNAFSGAISACAGTQFSNVTAYKNGMVATANSYERAAVAIRASNISVIGGHFKDQSSKMINGVDISNSADKITVQANCDSSVATCVQQTTTPTSLLVLIPDALAIPATALTSGTLPAARLPSQYKIWDACNGKGIGDGLSAIPAGTYLQFSCVNNTGATVTITGVRCWTDNAGTSTLNAANNAASSLLTGAVTCNSTKASGGAAGTQSATTTLANGDAISFTFVADGTSKQANWIVSGTY